MKGRTLQEIAIEIDRQAKAKRDFVAPVERLEIVPGDKDGPVSLALGPRPYPGGYNSGGDVVALDARQRFPINNLAHAQIAEFVGIPKNYYDTCLQHAPHVLAKQVNHWLTNPVSEDQRKAGPRLVRVLDNKVRAFLSNGYRRIENYDLAQAVLPVLQELNLAVLDCEITERRLYIKAFDPAIMEEIQRQGSDPAHTFIRKSDKCYAATLIRNSEVGCGMAEVAAGVFDDGCTNFVSFNNSSWKKYHTGARMEAGAEVFELLSDETKAKTDEALFLQLRDITKAAFTRAHFEAVMRPIKESVGQKFEAPVVEVMEVTAEKFGFTKAESAGVLQHLIEGGDLSRYGLMRAVTRAAQDTPDYDRQVEFERIGGKVIELSSSEWTKLAKAA